MSAHVKVQSNNSIVGIRTGQTDPQSEQNVGSTRIKTPEHCSVAVQMHKGFLWTALSESRAPLQAYDYCADFR